MKTRTDLPPYPLYWKERVEQVRRRSGNRCECVGECGDPHLKDEATGRPRCNAPNGEHIKRNHEKPWIWYHHSLCGICMGGGHVDAGDPPEPILVMLTTAHMNHDWKKSDPPDSDLEHLKHLCQRCHLNFDLERHVRNRAVNRIPKEQQPLFQGETP